MTWRHRGHQHEHGARGLAGEYEKVVAKITTKGGSIVGVEGGYATHQRTNDAFHPSSLLEDAGSEAVVGPAGRRLPGGRFVRTVRPFGSLELSRGDTVRASR